MMRKLRSREADNLMRGQDDKMTVLQNKKMISWSFILVPILGYNRYFFSEFFVLLFANNFSALLLGKKFISQLPNFLPQSKNLGISYHWRMIIFSALPSKLIKIKSTFDAMHCNGLVKHFAFGAGLIDFT